MCFVKNKRVARGLAGRPPPFKIVPVLSTTLRVCSRGERESNKATQSGTLLHLTRACSNRVYYNANYLVRAVQITKQVNIIIVEINVFEGTTHIYDLIKEGCILLTGLTHTQ